MADRTETRLSVAGIPFVHEAAPGLELPDRIAIGWPGSRVCEPPIRIRHSIGDAAPRGLRPLFEVPLVLGEYYLDDARNIAIRSRPMDVPGLARQLMRTRRAGFEYEIEYSDPGECLRLQWAWHRTIFMLALPLRARGLAIHATGFLLPGGECVVCPGVSGTGKSTLARTLKGGARDGITVLSDDRIAITLEGSDVHAWGTPWCSAAEAAAPDDGPVAALVFVKHGAGAGVAPLARGVALRRLLRTVGFPFWDPASTAFALQVVERLLEEVPCFEFTYAPGPAAADALLDGIRLGLGAGR